MSVKKSSYRDFDYPFGQSMLALRAAMHLSQVALAELLGVSRRAVGDWEAGSSYPKPEHLRHLVELAVRQAALPPGNEIDTIRTLWQTSHQKVLLNEAWLAALFAPPVEAVPLTAEEPPAAVRRASAGLPFQPTPFIGRQTELDEIDRILSDPACRLLTLIGPGGIGKTRLSIEVAARYVSTLADGVVFVPLASVSTPGQIIPAIGASLNLSFVGQADPTSYTLDVLRTRQLLLVLDNFEHLLAGTELIRQILDRAPGVTLLLTSRERLSLRAEWLYDVVGLTYPARDTHRADALSAPANLSEFSAVQLFVQRAAQSHPGFPVNDLTLTMIARICQSLAGMPLAIELAAAALRMLPLAQIERQIRSNLDVLATTYRDMPPRHRSLRAAFDQSWNLLTGPEQVLFSRLGVFRGGCTGEAAEQVTGATWAGLMALFDKSLIQQQTESLQGEGESRCMLLEPLREYALEKLAARGEAQTLQRAHAAYYLTIAEKAADQWDTATAEAALARVGRDYDNMLAALQWAGEADLPMGLQLGAALIRYWRSRGYLSEARAHLEALLERDDPNPEQSSDIRMRVLQGAAWLASDQHDFAHAEKLFEASMHLGHVLSEPGGEANLLANAALQARSVGDYPRATALLEQALARHRAINDQGNLIDGGTGFSRYFLTVVFRGLGFSIYLLALVYREQGDYARATALFEECIEFHRKLGEREGITQGMLGLGDVARDQGHSRETWRYSAECLATFREMGMQWAIGFALNNLAQAAYFDGELSKASALIDESIGLFRVQKADASLAEALITSGQILLAQGDLVSARSALIDALRLAWVMGPRLFVAVAMEGLAEVLVQLDDVGFAVRLLGSASALREQMGTPVRPADRPARDRALSVARSTLGDPTFDFEFGAAGKLPLDEVVSSALA